MRVHMNDPSNMLDRQAAVIAVEATMTNLELLCISVQYDMSKFKRAYSENPDLGRPSLVGRGGRGRL
jgi:hypothetical protein